MLVRLDLRIHVMCLCFLLENKMFELDCSAIETECCSAMSVCITHCLVIVRLNDIPRREAVRTA